MRRSDPPTPRVLSAFKPRSIFSQSSTTLSSTRSWRSSTSTFARFKLGVCEPKASGRVTSSSSPPRVLETLADVAEHSGIRYEQVVWARVDIRRSATGEHEVVTTPILLSIAHYPEPEVTGAGVTWLTGNGGDVRYVPIARGGVQRQEVTGDGPHDFLLPSGVEKVIINVGSDCNLLRFNLPQDVVELVVTIGDDALEKPDGLDTIADSIYESTRQLLHDGLTLRIVGSHATGLATALRERLTAEVCPPQATANAQRQALFHAEQARIESGQVPTWLAASAPDQREARLRSSYLDDIDQCIVSHSRAEYAEAVGAEVYALEMGEAGR
ncbi:uncharacterized protein LOC62_02G001796 [Vanrija pseudolonga]|uniref:Uncharacterized protein n=1 Tax=Vanrija pseudolonga TaxID=143232 RepID=A0AAF0Y5P7_9TREE|nr:hypothetical protein LOC62_02G001796 [Vanrija pseudolonga]